MIKTLRNLLKQDKERFVVPRGVQDVIPIKAIYDDGIFQVGRDKFSKTYKFSDINYAVASREDKFLAHALKSACPAVRRLSKRATERNTARNVLKEPTKSNRQSTQEESGQSRKIGAEKASNIKAFQLPHFEG